MTRRSVVHLVLTVVLLLGSQVSRSQEARDISDKAVAERHGVTVEDVQRLQQYRHLTNEHMIDMAPSRIGKILWRLDNNLPDLPLAAAEFRQLQQLGAGEPVAATPIGGAIDQLKEQRSRVRKLAGTAPGTAAISQNQTLSGTPESVVAGMPVGPLVAERPQAAAAGARPDPNLGILQLELQPLPNLRVGQPRAATVAPGGISRAKWKWLGPGNVGGRSRALVIHPELPNIMWVASVAGGIWKTTNGGASWGPLADFMANLNASTLVLDRVNPDVLFAGTGEGFYNLDAYRGAGIFRSTDGGAIWTQLPATAIDSFTYVYRLALTQDGATLLVATRQGVFRSTNFHDSDAAKISFQPTSGLTNREVLTVLCHPTDPARCIAGGRGRTSYHSNDAGATWQLSTGLPHPDPGEEFGGRVELAYARKDPNVVYASVDNNEGEVYRSRDGGKTFELRSVGTGGYLSSQGWYGNTIWADDPGDENFLIVGGIELHRSLDGGATFEAISDWDKFPATAHADQHSIVSHPNYNGTSNTTVFFTNDGGVYRNDDVINTTTTSGWVSLNNNFGVTQFYGAAGNLASGRIVGGTQDNGSVLYQPPPGPNTGPNAYTTMSYGDGGYAAADPADPNYFYGEYVYLMIQRSTNGGLKAGYIYHGIDDAGSRNTANFIAPFILDPINSNGMFAGGQSLWRSNNVRSATPSWHRIKEPIQEGLISAIAAARTESGKKWSDNLWVGYSAASLKATRGAGQVFVSTDADTATPTWKAVGQGKLPKRFVNRIRIDPKDARRVYTAFSGYFPGNLQRTTDGGTTWEDIGKELPSVSIYDIAIHPSDSRLLYAGTEVGVFASGDGGQSWWATNEGPANVVVYELFWMGDLLVAATHGRGLFWIDLSGGPRTAENIRPSAAAPASAATPEIGPARSRGSPAIILPQQPVRPIAE